MVNTLLIRQFLTKYGPSHTIKIVADVPLYKSYGVLLVAKSGQDKHTLGFLFNDIHDVYHIKAYASQYLNRII